MYNEISLIAEIDAILDTSDEWNVKDITAEICAKHEHEIKGDTWFSRYNIRKNVSKVTRERINARTGDERKKTEPEELEAKAKMLEQQAIYHAKHAEELRAYNKQRKIQRN